MPEGHTVHRTAIHLNEWFADRDVQVLSPQGRFSSDAKKISGLKFVHAWAVGKQMFIDFERDLTVRIHLGIYGKWQFHASDQEPDVVGQVRLRLQHANHVVDLRGPTICELIDQDAVERHLKRLGPDPLNPNPRGIESARFVERVRASKSAIGLLLMNQEVVSGIGNVYRAELLYRAGIEPHTPGCELSNEQVLDIWRDSVKLLKVGVKTGFMITRDGLLAKNPEKAERNWVYKREGKPCRNCGTKVSIEIMAGRKLYWCAGCQV